MKGLLGGDKIPPELLEKGKGSINEQNAVVSQGVLKGRVMVGKIRKRPPKGEGLGPYMPQRAVYAGGGNQSKKMKGDTGLGRRQ